MTTDGDDILTTARLRLREIEAADAPFVRALLNDPGFLANIGDRGVRSDADAERYIVDRLRIAYPRDGFGFYLVAKDGDPIGICGLVRRDGLPAPDLGFAFLERHCCRGYGGEAAAAMLRHGREVLGLDPILAITDADNVASIALLRRLGFVAEGMVELPGIDGPSRLFRHARERAHEGTPPRSKV